MHRESLVMVCTCEMAGRVRGKAFPAADLAARMQRGVGWVPTNAMISCFGPIHATPFGTTGDLVLVPDPAAEVNVDFADGSAPEHFFLGDLRHLDGTPWECCPRDFLRRALAALHEATGLELLAAFEHEFVLQDLADGTQAAYTLDAFRRQGAFGEALTAAIRAAGLVPDSFMAEYGAGQYEVTVAPAFGLAVADQAVILREMVRATAHRRGHRASFAPILDPAGVGSGVHLHMSFRDAEGAPAMYDAGAPMGLSATGRRFAAGILRHLPALCAITAPSAASCIRLRPNRWAPTHADLQDMDRGAALRVAPLLRSPGSAAAGRQFNVEYRVADAAASPYLALGAVVWAGVEGIRAGLDLPEGGPKLPESLGAALDALEADQAAAAWFGPTHLGAYLMHKRGELGALAGVAETEVCRRYAAVY